MSIKVEVPNFDMGEEIVHCPMCGTRTEFIARGVRHQRQLHWCLNPECDLIFTVTEDDDEA